MGLFETSTLKFDIDQIEEMEKKIKDTVIDLQDLKTKLIQSIDQLKKDWNTPAGKKFIKEVDTNWSVQIDKYVKVLNAVDELLKTAATEYEKVESSATKISF